MDMLARLSASLSASPRRRTAESADDRPKLRPRSPRITRYCEQSGLVWNDKSAFAAFPQFNGTPCHRLLYGIRKHYHGVGKSPEKEAELDRFFIFVHASTPASP